MTERWLSEMSTEELQEMRATCSRAADGSGPIPGTYMRAESRAIVFAIDAELRRRGRENS